MIEKVFRCPNRPVAVSQSPAGRVLPALGLAVPVEPAGVPGLHGGLPGHELDQPALLLQGEQTPGNLQRHDSEGTAAAPRLNERTTDVDGLLGMAGI